MLKAKQMARTGCSGPLTPAPEQAHLDAWLSEPGNAQQPLGGTPVFSRVLSPFVPSYLPQFSTGIQADVRGASVPAVAGFDFGSIPAPMLRN